MSRHTPGPWKARKCGGQGWPGQRGWEIDYNDAQEQVVDFVYEEADAHLIAAAPDLLDLAELVYLSFGGGRVLTFSDEQIEQFASVIAKAKGELA